MKEIEQKQEVYYFETEYTIHVTTYISACNLEEAELAFQQYGEQYDSELTDRDWSDVVMEEIESNLDSCRHVTHCVVEQTRPTTITCFERDECKRV